MVTLIVARSSSRVTDANPVIDLIIRLPSRVQKDPAYFASHLPAPPAPPALGRHDPAVSLSSQELHLIQRRVGTRRTRKQLVVPSHLYDAPPFQHDDHVGAPDCRQPMRDDERR